MDSKSKLDQFLAAPEEIITNPSELKKLRQRKAQDEARIARERAGKSDDLPSMEDMLADLVRVAEDEDLNPWHKFRSLSKRRYELYGHYPIESVIREFGYFNHAKAVAGLNTPTVGERQFCRAQTQRSLKQHDARYMERRLLPHVGKFRELNEPSIDIKTLGVISDLHGLFLDPFTWDVFVDTMVDLEPDCVYINGDGIDGLEISTHAKVPGTRVSLQLELDFIRCLFKELREKLPKDTPIVWGAGNHFLDRVVRYLTQVAPALANLRCLKIDNLVGLDELDIELVQGGTFISPENQKNSYPRKILWGKYMVTHGTTLGKFPAAGELERWGMSGTSGHVHRAHVFFGNRFKNDGLTWMSTPMACIEDVGRYYIKDHAGWQKGFGLAFVSDDIVKHEPIITDTGTCIVEGKVYKKGEDYPTRDDEVKAYWLERYGLKDE